MIYIKNFIKPKHYIQLSLISLGVIIIMGLLTGKIGKHAQACGNVQINASTTVATDFNNTNTPTFGFSVWRDTCTGNEYASAHYRGGLGNIQSLSVTIKRNDGGDSRGKTCTNMAPGATCITPEMPLNGHTANASIYDLGISVITSNF